MYRTFCVFLMNEDFLLFSSSDSLCGGCPQPEACRSATNRKTKPYLCGTLCASLPETRTPPNLFDKCALLCACVRRIQDWDNATRPLYISGEGGTSLFQSFGWGRLTNSAGVFRSVHSPRKPCSLRACSNHCSTLVEQMNPHLAGAGNRQSTAKFARWQI